ncbi:50S ribosomal protein L15 [Candidatus Gracilibacteria bacterium]|nr:50S ribosomal protein L15 [Candidatus Gracilibacteria bacterium]
MLQNEFSNPLKVSRKRVGRGDASGKGRTCGKGDKGQNARKGSGPNAFFEGGQTPLYKRLPKLKGFTNIFKKEYDVVNLSSIANLEGEITLETLSEKGVISGKTGRLKVLGNGEVKNKISLKAVKVSASAKEKIEKAGGKVEILSK